MKVDRWMGMKANGWWTRSLLSLAFLILLPVWTNSSFHLYMQKKEVKRLLGLNAELTYVREGKVNDYALGFVVLVPDHISNLHFTWQRLSPLPMPYSIGITVSDTEALGTPQLNISRRGLIPTQEEVFQVVLPCTGKTNAEVEVQIYVNITMPSSNVTALVLRRKKICLKDGNHNGTILMANAMTATTSSFIIGVGCASAVMVVITVMAIASCLRAHKTRRRDAMNFGGSSPALSAQCQTFLRVDTPNNASTAGSYSSFRRLTPVPIMTSNQVNDLKLAALLEQLSDIRVDSKKITLQEKIKEGTFGQIYQGVLVDENDVSNNQQVFVKTVSDQASQTQISLLLSEGTMLFGMNHTNILPVIAICLDDLQHPLLVYPYMNQGNLKQFLQKCKSSAEGHCHKLLTQELVAIAIQIVEGMIYLHKKKLIHTDLAARNCVIDNWLNVRITDNALSRDLFPNDYHCLGDNENRPVKWLALESLLHKEFTPSSDVWAFGVTLWELITLGQQPYTEIDPFEMGAYLRDNYRLVQPINCPDQLYTLMSYCWASAPDKRPAFGELLMCLREFYAALGQYV